MKRIRVFSIALGLLLIFQLATPAVACQDCQLPNQSSTATSWFAPEFQISPDTPTGVERYNPRVAYNWIQHEYLVVWHNLWPSTFREIYARRLSSTGKLLSWLSVASGMGGDYEKRDYPAVAYNAASGEYLVVYSYDASGNGQWEVWGRRVGWDASWTGPEFRIFKWANRAFVRPRVAWNSYRNEYLVVANAWDTTTNRYNDVAGRRVMPDGTTPDDGYSISHQDQTLQPQEADITYNVAADEYLVIWRQRWSGDDWDIWGARVRGIDGQVVDPPSDFAIDDTPVDQDYPALITNQQDRYLLAWQQGVGNPATDWDVYGLELDITGSPVGSSFPIAYSAEEEKEPAIAINGGTNQRFVAWMRIDSIDSSHETWVSSWYPSAPPLSWVPMQISSDAEGGSSAVASGSSHFITVYRKTESSVMHIFGRMYWPESVFLPIIMQ